MSPASLRSHRIQAPDIAVNLHVALVLKLQALSLKYRLGFPVPHESLVKAQDIETLGAIHRISPFQTCQLVEEPCLLCQSRTLRLSPSQWQTGGFSFKIQALSQESGALTGSSAKCCSRALNPVRLKPCCDVQAPVAPRRLQRSGDRSKRRMHTNYRRVRLPKPVLIGELRL